MPERGPRDTGGGGGGGAPEESRGPESGAEGTPAGSEETRDESAAEGTEERAEEPREETPPAETPAPPVRETTPEAERGERVDWLEKVASETKEREEAFYKEKYGDSRWGRMKRWLNETDAGKAVKIGSKIVLGTAAAVTATALTGGAGLLLAPALYGLGIKSAVDGGIEAASYLLKGRGMRIAIEGARADMRQSTEERFGELRRMHEAGEIDESVFAERVAALTKEIAQKEKEVIQKETERMKWEKKEAMVRAIASTVASVGVMCFTGIPLGVQNFDADKASHAVRFTWRGFEFIYHAGEKMAHTVHGLAFGLKTHAIGHAFGPPAAAFVGLGGAAVGMFAKTASELRAAKERGEITSDDPRYISGAGEYGGRARRPEARRPGGGGPHRPTGGPEGTGHAPGGTPGAEARGAPSPAVGGVAGEGAAEGEGAGARGGESGEEGAAAEAERVTPEELRRFIAESGARRTELIGSLEDINSQLRVLDEEQERIEGAGVKTPETETRIREIAEERARLEEQKENIKTEIDHLDEIERTSEEIGTDDGRLRTVEGEYYALDSKDTKTEEERRRMETLTEESKSIRETNEGRRESLREMVRVIKRRAAAGGEGGDEGAGGPAEEEYI